MPIYALGNFAPQIHPEAFVHPDAILIGDVRVAAQASIWPGAVLRGDDGVISVGERTSIQDGTVCHVAPGTSTVVGADCVIGHVAHLEGCTIADGAQVSSGAVVLHRVSVGTGAIVAANAVVLNDMVVPPGALAVGAPAVIKEGRAKADSIALGVLSYVHRVQRYSAELRRID